MKEIRTDKKTEVNRADRGHYDKKRKEVGITDTAPPLSYNT
jgi:hypothetical protein